ncbi:MAG: DUF1887 family protein [Erysipelotrichaceae bacterium]|nr:DUF1887 family protein [Erysipelotrichaceae bacterium]
MKTLIEILDYEQTENIISPLVFDFEQIVFIYDINHNDPKKRRTLRDLLQSKNINNLVFLQVDQNDDSIFDQLVLKYPECIFNLSNGSRTLLVKMTRYCERTHQRCYTLNFQRKTFCNLHGCDDLEKRFKVPHLSVANIIELSSGEIIKTAHALPSLDEEMLKDLRICIDVMNHDSNAWTRLLGVFAKELKEEEMEDSFWMAYPEEKTHQILLNQLKEKQILHWFDHGSKIRIVFKNHKLMKLFTDSGAWLEYQSYLECLDSGYFDDVRISTVVDWNKESQDNNDPTCEIDLIVIKNCIPAFVSCKMNKCSALDLYEIKLLSKKLGGSLGRAAVISKAASLERGQPLYLKAQELEITVIGQKDIEAGNIADALLNTLR